MLTLQEAFAQVPDPRGSRGKRYPLATFLVLILLATMSGYRGYRELERFMDRHQQVLAQRLGLPHRSTQSETRHGRASQRTVSTFALADSLKQKWSGAQQAVQIH